MQRRQECISLALNLPATWICGWDQKVYANHLGDPVSCSMHGLACRCVSRFDHHCPAISNCVGKGNQRAYSAWLSLLLLAQLLFLHLAALFCARTARHHWGATGQHDRGGFMDVLPGLWLIFRLHPGKLLLIVIEVGRAACLSELPVAHMSVCASVCPSVCLSICPRDPRSRGAEHRF